MKKILLFFTLVLLGIHISILPAAAGEVEILIDKLVEKGILSPDDAKEILQETKEAAKQERAAVVKETTEAVKKQAPAPASDIPQWVRKMSLKGDFRLRYQKETRRLNVPDRHRGRIRLRIGVVTEITDNIEVGFGIATGGSDPRSTNQTLQNTFDSPDLRLDYAYAAWRPITGLTLIGGKFKNPLWTPTDLLYDGDIRPEGVSILYKTSVGESLEVFINAGAWILDEYSNDSNDPMMFVVQPGYKLKLGKRAYFKNALSWYEFNDVEGANLDHSAGTNQRDAAGNLQHDYDALVFTGELGIKRPFDLLPFAALFGEYIKNTNISDDDYGWIIGLKFGDKKVKKLHQWQFKTMYRYLERDAWVDTFPDGDVYGGQTNVRGWVFKVAYGLQKNVSLGLAFHNEERIDGGTLSRDLFQADLVLKF